PTDAILVTIDTTTGHLAQVGAVPLPGDTDALAFTSSFATWQKAKFTASELLDANVSGPNAVFGVDGLSNLVKYALGLEPKQNVTTGLPATNVVGPDWVYTYTRPSSVTDVTYAVEISTNLSTWTTAGVTHEFVSSGGGTEAWHAKYP